MRPLRWARALAVAALVFGGGDQERGIQLLAQGQFGEAAQAFRAAIESEGPSAELSYNLALALWRAGQLDEAETAAETAATLSDGALAPLRDGLLGNLRYAAAQSKETAQDLEGAVGLARQARDHFLRGAVSKDAPPEIARNLERAEKLITDLEKKIEEQKKKDEEKKDQDKKDDQKKKDDENKDQKDQDQKKDDDKKDDDKKDEEKKQQEDKKDEDKKDQDKKDDQKKQDEKQGDQQDQQQDEKQSEPKPSEEKKPEEAPEPKPEEQEKKPEPQKQQPPAPGEQQEGRELTPEEKKQLEEQLDKFQQALLELRAQQKAQRPKVKKDW